jgi:predicted enzyme related to lactoylglutathione lyase
VGAVARRELSAGRLSHAGLVDQVRRVVRIVSGTVKAAAVIYVKGIDRVSAFYERCLGLVVADAAESYRVLESEAWTLSLVVVAHEVAATIDIAVPPRRREDLPVKLVFAVSNIEDVRRVAASLGGEVDGKGDEWDFQGWRHCDGVDPEGNVIQLREPLAKRA